MTRSLRFACIPVVLALCGLAACRPKQTSSNDSKPSKPTKTPSSIAADPDDEDENGDDSPNESAPPAAISAKGDAEDQRRALAASLAMEMPDPVAAAKKLGPPKVELKKDGKGKCGVIHVAGHDVKLDCDTDGYGEVKNAAKPLLDEDDIGASSSKLPDLVDFRAKKQVGPLIDQGGSLSCTAVSLAHVVNHELALRVGKPGAVSAMQMWGRYANPSMNEAIETNQGKGIAPATALPYDWRTADKWDKTNPPPKSFLSQFDSQAVASIVDVVQINPKNVKGTLAQGHAVWFAIHGAHGLQKTEGAKGGPQVVPAYDYQTMPSNQRMGHAMAMMGYRVKDGKTLYLLQNSWGTGYGEGGYAYIDETTFFKNVKYAYSIEVSQTGAKPQTNVAITKCKPGHLPDAVSGVCAPRCTDGSARNGGACAVAGGDCPSGQVNVQGRCVRAAPTLRTKKDGIAANCVPGGCAYAVDRGKYGCTRSGGCVVTCAAPTFKLIQHGTKLACN